ncbi:hypothetical protein M1247_31675 [Mycobacterium sp. 21AC1]|uniref:EspA/EspE family type VII secretion system effector n=1 Tax=[Mycobacterium] appelbergii TaxID=2939269 RepID=UPI0029394934|nr:EspA/EspE family type VII secretion system effector [Mycobacterium sp. 21AC1]MDV3129503.1 hypothetical protein [Mycobacterium sp. 21AC1]
MSLFDTYGDFMQKFGGALETVGPFLGPMGFPLAEAGSAITGIASTIDTIEEQGVDGLWNAASQVAEGASVVEFFLSKSKVGGTTIISGGLKTIQGMQAACGGTNAPEMADGYSESAQRFNLIADHFEKAIPDDNWTGTASEAYADANASQTKRSRTMPDIDLDVVMAVTMEANQLRATRRILNDSATVMGNAIAPAIALRSFGRYGKLFSLDLEASVTGSCLAGCFLHMKHLTDAAEKASKSIDNAARLYQAIADECYPTQM